MRVFDFDAIFRPDNIVGIDKYLAKQETKRHHRWAPSQLQIQQVANLLNSTALVPPVVIIRGRRVTEDDSKHRFPVLESRPTEPGGPGVNREIVGWELLPV
jgi:hypothetical protein